MSDQLLDQEKLVYELIQVYLKKRRPLEVDKLLPVISSELFKKSNNINSKRIKQIIKSLLKKKYIIEGSRLTKDDILKNKVRIQIYGFICENSAVYFHQIKKKLELPTHSVIWHLNLLFLFGFIKRIKIKKHYNHYIYFTNDLSSQEARKIYFTKNHKCKEIIEYLKLENKGYTRTHLSKQLGMHLNTIKKYITILEDIEIIYREELSNKSLYYIVL